MFFEMMSMVTDLTYKVAKGALQNTWAGTKTLMNLACRHPYISVAATFTSLMYVADAYRLVMREPYDDPEGIGTYSCFQDSDLLRGPNGYVGHVNLPGPAQVMSISNTPLSEKFFHDTMNFLFDNLKAVFVQCIRFGYRFDDAEQVIFKAVTSLDPQARDFQLFTGTWGQKGMARTNDFNSFYENCLTFMSQHSKNIPDEVGLNQTDIIGTNLFRMFNLAEDPAAPGTSPVTDLDMSHTTNIYSV